MLSTSDEEVRNFSSFQAHGQQVLVIKYCQHVIVSRKSRLLYYCTIFEVYVVLTYMITYLRVS